MSRFGKRYYDKKRRKSNDPSSTRFDALPFKIISREQVNAATEDFIKKGGKITKITEDDILRRRREDIDRYGFYEAHNFLNGD